MLGTLVSGQDSVYGSSSVSGRSGTAAFSKRKIFAALEEAGCFHRKSSRKNLLLIINKTKK